MSESALGVLQEIMWPDGPICPHCSSAKFYAIKGESTRDGLYKCAKCRKQYTVMVGTIMNDTHLTADQWVGALRFLLGAKRSIRALGREIGVPYKTAYSLAHRLRCGR